VDRRPLGQGRALDQPADELVVGEASRIGRDQDAGSMLTEGPIGGDEARPLRDRRGAADAEIDLP
jgi:hypothetical protein